MVILNFHKRRFLLESRNDNEAERYQARRRLYSSEVLFVEQCIIKSNLVSCDDSSFADVVYSTVQHESDNDLFLYRKWKMLLLHFLSSLDNSDALGVSPISEILQNRFSYIASAFPLELLIV